VRTKDINQIRSANPKWGTSKKRKPPPLTEQLSILEYQEYKCEQCGCELTKENTEFDHIVPYAVVPISWRVALCRPCNRAKGRRVLVEPPHE
jgi:5-methylcytosine-specific restriction endonuclease McrA